MLVLDSPDAHSPLAMVPGATPTDTPPIAGELGDAERTRLVRLCLRYTRDPDAAEDLAQETLIEAWRGWHKLRDPGDERARANWLGAIAMHVCRRWARRRGREAARLVGLEARMGVQESENADPHDAPDPQDWLADDGDIEAELDRAELLALLERALALLPPTTRDLLLARYLLEQPPAEIAARQGLSEATLAVRLHRARQALRQIFATTLHADAAAHGLLPDLADGAEGWQQTRIWCPTCGRVRLSGRFDRAAAHLELRCPRCAATCGELLDHVSYQRLLDGVSTFKAALNRVMAWADPYYRAGVAAREVVCLRCGRSAPILLAPLPGTLEAQRDEPGLHAACRCPARNNSGLSGLALFTPEGRRFWREHPRMRLLPTRQVETDGRDAVVIGYESVAGAARLDTLFARDTFELLAIHTTPGA